MAQERSKRRRTFLFMTSVRALLVAMLTGLLLGGLCPAPAIVAGPTLIDLDPEDCEERVPAAYAAPVPAGANIAIDTTILLDGVTKPEAQKIVRANTAYADLSLEIVPTFRRFGVKPDGTQTDEQDQAVARIEVTRLVAEAKASFGGSRPASSDVVYVLTSKDVYLEGSDSDVLGWAECIGGIRYPNRAFAVGEVSETFTTAGLNFYLDASAKVLGHEIGHLLGAHHEYGNCVQGIGGEDVTNREPAFCTLMFGYIDFQSLDFGAVDGAVIRGHAQRYAGP
jgi:predicted Zn-dependent protease